MLFTLNTCLVWLQQLKQAKSDPSAFLTWFVDVIRDFETVIQIPINHTRIRSAMNLTTMSFLDRNELCWFR